MGIISDVKVGDKYKNTFTDKWSYWKFDETKTVIEVERTEYRGHSRTSVRFSDIPYSIDTNSMYGRQLEYVGKEEYYTFPKEPLPEGWEDWDGSPVIAEVWETGKENRKQIRIVLGYKGKHFVAQAGYQNDTVDTLKIDEDELVILWDHAKRIPRPKTKTISIEGKSIDLSNESFENLKAFFKNL